jgi:hypothetical protein
VQFDPTNERIEDRVAIRIDHDGEIAATTLASILTAVEDSYAEAVTLALTTGLVYPFNPAQLNTVTKILELRKGRFFRVTRVRSGSVELLGTAGLAALFLFILQGTVGETLKDAYKKSAMHRRLIHLLTRKVSLVHEVAHNKAVTRLRQLDDVAIQTDRLDRRERPFVVEREGFYLRLRVCHRDFIDEFERKQRGKF